MDLKYLKIQIEDELSGYEDYKAKAEEHPEFADTFNEMAKQEHGHAENLMAILKKQIDKGETVYKHYSERMNK